MIAKPEAGGLWRRCLALDKAALFDMLLPNRLKELAPHQRCLILLVDNVSARYPWEMLEDRWDASARPPAFKAGLVRHLKTPQFRLRPAHALSKTALAGIQS